MTCAHLRPPRPPDFGQLLAVLRNGRPERATLFEFIVDPAVILPARDLLPTAGGPPINHPLNWLRAFYAAGYDFAALPPWQIGMLHFPAGDRPRDASISQFEGGVIRDRESFLAYGWPEPDALDYSIVDQVSRHLPAGMQLVGMAWSGVLENMIDLVGFEGLCFMLADEPGLVREIADAIGSRLLRHYEKLLEHDAIGACVVNDDWGFKTQTLLAPAQLREFVFPWHRRIVAAIHAAGRPAVLHSCGQMAAVWDDIIDGMRFDAKHSFEDAVLPVEDAWRSVGARIAILGGLDVDFLCRSTPEEVERRARALLDLTAERGGYALGSGNSIAPYLPPQNYHAMRRAALENLAPPV